VSDLPISALSPQQVVRLQRLRQVTHLLDNAIAIPGTNRRVGLDPILGLLPGGGDTLSAALSGYIIVEAAFMGLPRATLVRMVINLLTDTVLGSVPLAGDLFDVAFKANSKNLQLIEAHVQTPHPSPKADKLFIALLIAGLILFAIGVGGITVLTLTIISRFWR
jgi:hypothetical protein